MEVDTGEPAEAPSSASLECTAVIQTLMNQGGRRGLTLELSSSLHKRAVPYACPHSHTQTCRDTETTICTSKEIQHLTEQGNTKPKEEQQVLGTQRNFPAQTFLVEWKIEQWSWKTLWELPSILDK